LVARLVQPPSTQAPSWELLVETAMEMAQIAAEECNFLTTSSVDVELAVVAVLVVPVEPTSDFGTIKFLI
jgi:hypothetical protein